MYGGILTVNYHTSYIRLNEAMAAAGVKMGGNNVYNESLVSRARNRLVDVYLKETDFTHACFIDADIGFDPLDIIAMLEQDLPILGVPCPKKTIRWDRIQLATAIRYEAWRHQNPNGSPEEFLTSTTGMAALNDRDMARVGGDLVMSMNQEDTLDFSDLTKPQPMRLIGTGLLMIKREVFEKFTKVYPNRWFEQRADAASNPGKIFDFFKVGVNPETREYLSEDYWFIHDCKQMGYTPMIAPWVKTTHMGTFEYCGDVTAILGSTGKLF